MTISSESRKSPLYVGSGTTGPFAFTFKVFAASDVRVTTAVIATGVETTLTLTTDYTVSLNAEQDGNPGGTITLTSSLPATKSLVITSAVPLTQPVDINNQDGFFAEVIEDALDRSVVQVQQMQVDLDRAFKVPLTSGYTDPNEFITDLLNTDAAAQAARVGAEAAETAAVAAQTAAESAQAGAETAETNAESYVNTVTAATSTVYANYAAAIAALGSGDDGTVFRVQYDQSYYVYLYNEAADVGDLQHVVPVDATEATIASSQSNGLSVSNAAIPAGAIIDIVGVDALYSPNQIRNRAQTGRPTLNILGVSDPSEEPLRHRFSQDDVDDQISPFAYDVNGDLTVAYVSSSANPAIAEIADVRVPPGRWTFAFDAAGQGANYDFRYSADGGASYGSGTASNGVFNTFFRTVTKTSWSDESFEFFRDHTSAALGIAYKNFRIIPGDAAAFTQPTNRHGWHKRPWSFDTGSLVPTNDSNIVDNLHFQLPLGETKQLNEYTVSFAIKPADNAYANAFSLTSPSTAADKFGMLLVPSTDALSVSSGFISFDHLGSTDDTVQLLGVAIPKEKFSVLTVVAPADEGINSEPSRVYINGILLREVEEQIRVKTSSRDADGGSLRFNFGKAHRFVEDEPVNLQKDTGAVFPAGVDDATTYYVRPPSSNFQETLLLSTTAGGTPIAFTNAGSGNIFVNSETRPVGTAPILLNCLSLFGFKTIEPSTFNLKGEFANFVLYDKALTESEVQSLIAVQKQRVSAHYEPMSALGSVLITEGDSITFGVGTTNPTQTFRFRLFYGLDFNTKVAASSAFSKSDNATAMTTSDVSGNLRFTAANHAFPQGVSVVVTGSPLPDNILSNTTYYVNVINDNNIQLTTDDTMLNVVPAGAGLGSNVSVTFADTSGNVREAMLVNLPTHGYDGTGVTFETTNTLPLGLTENAVYFAQKKDADNFFVSRKGFVSNAFPLILGQSDYGAIGDVTIKEHLSTLDNDALKLNEKNYSTSGATIENIIARKDRVLEMINRVVSEGSRPIVTFLGGVNNMIVGGASGPLTDAEQAALIDNLKVYWTELRDAGAKVIVCTVTAVNFTDPGELNGPFTNATDTVRNSFNAKLRAASDYYDALADLAAYDLLNDWVSASVSNSYFADSVHLSLRGQLLVANILSPLVDAFRLG